MRSQKSLGRQGSGVFILNGAPEGENSAIRQKRVKFVI